VVLLNNDTIVTRGWLEGLIALSLHDWPHTGMVGPVTNCASPPQQIAASYRTREGIDAFAERCGRDFTATALNVNRLIGFCLLIRREVLDKIGVLDEQFGIGFFEDDDLCVRAREAGYRLAVAQGVFIHHFGSRTFRGLGIDCHQQLKDGFARFRDKWGPEKVVGYRLPEEGIACGLQIADCQEEAGNETGADRPLQLDPTIHHSQLTTQLVSLCMIVKDAEATLGACLSSVRDLVDEMVVVDTGSSDRTREVAAEAGARVFDFAWVDSFAEARNESLRHARGRWILWLDADEYFDEENRERLRALLGELKNEALSPHQRGPSPARRTQREIAFTMRQRSELAPGLHAAAQVDQIRLFPSHRELRWQYRVHEQILPALRRLGAEVQSTDIVIAHSGFRDPAIQEPKVERNWRLLQLEVQERPDDPFVLYNLGAIALTRGQTAEALAFLQKSLDKSQPGDTLEQKLYVLLTRCHQELGQKDKALEVCRTGRALYPRDAELMFWEGVLWREQGSLAPAEACFLEVLRAPVEKRFTSIDAGLQGYRTRHLLAEIYREQGRAPEAEAQWRAAVKDSPGFMPAWLGLAELFLEQGRWEEADRAADRLHSDPALAVEAAVMRARAHLGRKEFMAARQLLEQTIATSPRSVWPRVILTHVLLQEGTDPPQLSKPCATSWSWIPPTPPPETT
jgi:GT2 family glycosyltransferase